MFEKNLQIPQRGKVTITESDDESAVILSVHNEETGQVSQIRLELPYARRAAYLLMDSAEIVSNKEFYRQKH